MIDTMHRPAPGDIFITRYKAGDYWVQVDSIDVDADTVSFSQLPPRPEEEQRLLINTFKTFDERFEFLCAAAESATEEEDESVQNVGVEQ